MNRVVTTTLLLAFAWPAGEVLAQRHVSAVSGAMAGRSPTPAYRTSSAATLTGACPINVGGSPAGRLATRVLPTRPEARCAAVRMADREESRTIGRD